MHAWTVVVCASLLVAVVVYVTVFVTTWDTSPADAILWEPVCQTGNCLRSLASAVIVGKLVNRPVLIQNVKVDAVDLRLLEPIFSVNVATNDCTTADTGTMIESTANVSGRWSEYYTNFDVVCEGEVESLPQGKITWRTIYAWKPAGLSDSEYVQHKFTFYAERLSTDWIAKARATIPVDALGMHIRWTDNMQDQQKVKNGLFTPLEAFTAKFNEWCSLYPARKIFICTDNESVLQTVTANDPGRVLRPGPWSEEMNRGKQAIWEMLLLSQCQDLAVTTGSTFSYEAAFMNRTRPPRVHVYLEGAWQMSDLT